MIYLASSGFDLHRPILHYLLLIYSPSRIKVVLIYVQNVTVRKIVQVLKKLSTILLIDKMTLMKSSHQIFVSTQRMNRKKCKSHFICIFGHFYKFFYFIKKYMLKQKTEPTELFFNYQKRLWLLQVKKCTLQPCLFQFH